MGRYADLRMSVCAHNFLVLRVPSQYHSAAQGVAATPRLYRKTREVFLRPVSTNRSPLNPSCITYEKPGLTAGTCIPKMMFASNTSLTAQAVRLVTTWSGNSQSSAVVPGGGACLDEKYTGML